MPSWNGRKIRKGAGGREKTVWAALAVGAAAGAWRVHRDRKYPARPELRFVNRLAVPGCVLNAGTARMANRALARMGMKLPAPPQEIESRGVQIPSEDRAMIHLTIYRLKAKKNFILKKYLESA